MNQMYTMIKHHLNTEAINKPVYIFDYDGTLSDAKHRLGKLPTKDLHLTESWSEFNRLSIHDDAIESTIQVMNGLFNSGAFVIILTGRSDEVCEISTQWLHDAGAKYNVMVMREAGDSRDYIRIKESHFPDYKKYNEHDVHLVNGDVDGGVLKVVRACLVSPSMDDDWADDIPW